MTTALKRAGVHLSRITSIPSPRYFTFFSSTIHIRHSTPSFSSASSWAQWQPHGRTDCSFCDLCFPHIKCTAYHSQCPLLWVTLALWCFYPSLMRVWDRWYNTPQFGCVLSFHDFEFCCSPPWNLSTHWFFKKIWWQWAPLRYIKPYRLWKFSCSPFLNRYSINVLLDIVDLWRVLSFVCGVAFLDGLCANWCSISSVMVLLALKDSSSTRGFPLYQAHLAFRLLARLPPFMLTTLTKRSHGRRRPVNIGQQYRWIPYSRAGCTLLY